MYQKRIIILLLSLTFTLPLFSQKRLTKKQLQKERIELLKTIDSLKLIIEGGATEFADTTNIEDEDTLAAEAITAVDSENFVEDGVIPGSNPDSLLSIWYVQKKLTHSRSNDFDMDSVSLQSNIPDEVYIDRLNKLNSFIPLSYNSIVRNHIIFYTEKIPVNSCNMLGLSSYYLPMFEEIFDTYNLPKELKAMAIIESALNPVAVSRVNAKGMWQFMYRTALQYDLKINSYIDERLDPIASAHAAAKFLKDSYAIFGDWLLAISSYNCGVGNVNKAIRRAGSKDFWAIYPYLPRETRGYVPSFIATLYFLNYYKEHGLKPTQFNLPAHVDTLHINKNLHFEQVSAMLGISIEDLKNYNPQYTQNIIPSNGNEGNILRLPYNYVIPFIDKEKEIYSYNDSVYFSPITAEKIKKEASMTSLPPMTHKVRNGETLGGIALKYRVKLSNLMRWNGLNSKSVLRIGQRLIINAGNGDTPTAANTSSNNNKNTSTSKAETINKDGYEWYTIKSGDTLLGIAYKFKGVSLSDILTLNNLTKTSKIFPGKKIKIRKL